MHSQLLTYYEAIERASAQMLVAARCGDWDQVLQIEGTCVLLIDQLESAARDTALTPQEATAKTRIMRRILLNDAEIRELAEPLLGDLSRTFDDRPLVLH